MRTFNTMRNAIASILFQIVTLLIGFTIPRLVIITYGSEVNGLTSNINQIISIINLLQAGIVGASIFEMFKPIALNDYDTIAKIFYSSKSYFDKLSKFFFAAILLIIPYIILGNKTTIEPLMIILSILILGINATFVFKYFCSYDVIFSAFQLKYKLVISMSIEKVAYYTFFFVAIFFNLHYIFMYIAVFVGSSCKILYITHEFNKLYKNKLKKWEGYSKYKVKNQYQLFGNQIVQNIIEVAPTIIVTFYGGLVKASILSIYMLVINVFKMLFSTIQNSIAASFGDLVAYGDIKKVNVTFSIIQFIFWIFGFICSVCCALLMLSFVKLYCDNTDGISYLYIKLSSFISIYIYCFIQFLPYNLLINTLGLYGSVLKSNIVNGIISLLTATLLAHFDFEYVYLGVILYYILSLIHRHILLNSTEYKINFINIVKIIGGCILIYLLSLLGNPFKDLIESWTTLMIVGFTSCISISVFIFLFSFLFEKEMIYKTIGIAKNLTRRKSK